MTRREAEGSSIMFFKLSPDEKQEALRVLSQRGRPFGPREMQPSNSGLCVAIRFNALHPVK